MRAQRTVAPPRHPLDPRIAGVRLSALLAHYRLRLRRQLAVELLAGAGIAAGVALVFGVLLANSSITGSAPALIRAVTGDARLQLRARSPEGFPEALALRAGQLPGVRFAAFVLRENGEIVGPGGPGGPSGSPSGSPSGPGGSSGPSGHGGRRAQIQLVGLSAGFVALHSAVTGDLALGAELLQSDGIGLPAPLAQAIGVTDAAAAAAPVAGAARSFSSPSSSSSSSSSDVPVRGFASAPAARGSGSAAPAGAVAFSSSPSPPPSPAPRRRVAASAFAARSFSSSSSFSSSPSPSPSPSFSPPAPRRVAAPGPPALLRRVAASASAVAAPAALRRVAASAFGVAARGSGSAVAAPAAPGAAPAAPGRVSLLIGGRRRDVAVRAVLGAGAIGAVAQAPIAVAGLETAQRLSGHAGRVSEVLIEPQPGADARVARELRALVAGRVSVERAGSELAILDATARPLGQSTSLFVAIGAMVGLLFVANALLLTLPERRRLVAELHAQGFEARQIVAILLSQALVLGAAASLAGLALGWLLARTVLQQSTVYLAAAFPIAGHQSMPATAVLAALAGGLAAAGATALVPLGVLRAQSPLAAAMQGAEHAIQRIGPGATRALAALGAALIALTTALALAAPALTILGGVLLALAVPCLMPALFAATLAVLKRAGRRLRGSMLALTAIELSATATRSVALIGVAGLAVYGSVSVQGARGDLVRGLDRAVVEFLQPAPLWVAANDRFLTLDGFADDGATAAIARTPGVREVRAYAGSLLDVGDRALWVRGRDPRDRPLLQASQLLHGDPSRADALIRRGGWAAVSSGFASERRLRVGSAFALPTPSGAADLRVAAITTNTGWSPGAITLNLRDYRRLWQSTRPTALEVQLDPGVAPAAARAAVARALAGRPGLLVQTRAQRVASFERSAREGLRSLAQISTLLLLSAALAVAAVLSASIWQRRARLAALGTQGFDHLQLWRAVVLESTIAVAVGCADGALLGLYGHALASRWLALATGFPAPFSPGLGDIALALALVAGATVALAAALGYRTARAAPALAFGEQG
jgi:putative ABC transport system permease protein